MPSARQRRVREPVAVSAGMFLRLLWVCLVFVLALAMAGSEAWHSPDSEAARRSLSFTVHVTSAAPGGDRVALSIVRSEWWPGRGSHAVAVRHEVVSPLASTRPCPTWSPTASASRTN